MNVRCLTAAPHDIGERVASAIRVERDDQSSNPPGEERTFAWEVG